MSTCISFANGLVPKDKLLSNITVTDTAALCNIVTKSKSNTIIEGVNTLLPINGDGSETDPITVKRGNSSIPEYVLWEDGTTWNISELQTLERADNVITIVNSNSVVDLSTLTSFLSVPNASIFVLSASSALNDQVIISSNSSVRLLTIQPPNGDGIDGSLFTAAGSSVSILAGNAGTTGVQSGGHVTISAGSNASINGSPGTVTLSSGQGLQASLIQFPNLILFPGITPSGTKGSTVFIGGPIDGTDSASHLAVGGKPPVVGPIADGYSVTAISGQYTDIAGQLSVEFIGGLFPQIGTIVRLTFAQPFIDPPATVFVTPLNAVAAQACISGNATDTELIFYVQNIYVLNGGNSTWKNVLRNTLAPFAFNPGAGDTAVNAWPGPALFSYLVVS
jgi:hypothetical protein